MEWIYIVEFVIIVNQKSRANLPIVRAISKHGMDNFTLVVLEFTTDLGAVPAEQIWIDTYVPEYNALTIAGTRLGYKHTDQNKAKRLVLGKARQFEKL